MIYSRKNNNHDNSSPNNNPRKDKHYPKKLKPIADTLKTGKDLINQGYEYADIDTSGLSESQQKKLEKYYNSKIKSGDNEIEKKHFLDTGPGLAVCIAGWVIVITGIISLIVWIVRRRKKKIKK